MRFDGIHGPTSTSLYVRAESVRADDAEVLLDVEFQRRLAEVIEQVLKRRRGFHH